MRCNIRARFKNVHACLKIYRIMNKINIQHVKKNLKFHKKWTVSFLQFLHKNVRNLKKFFLFLLVEKKNDPKLRKNSFFPQKKKILPQSITILQHDINLPSPPYVRTYV